MRKIQLKNFAIGSDQPLVVFSGPCVIESEEHCLRAAETLKKMFLKQEVNLVFKSSYDKANRSSYHSFRGPGIEEGLRILERVRQELELPVVTDVHSPEEAKAVGEVCEFIQIPAFLCRQTDLVIAAAKTGAVVQVKKGQFLAPGDMKNVVEKIESMGNEKIILIERGTTFGYNQLVTDMCSIPIMQEFGYPVCFDATHSVQKPGGLGTHSGGSRKMVPYLANAALAAGVDCLFLESHPDPEKAKSDAANVLDFKELDRLLPHFKSVHNMTKSFLNV
jgi:2-dehydro-3-deoxyphosphooctonate aldolase (KDO 8-P synthase)